VLNEVAQAEQNNSVVSAMTSEQLGKLYDAEVEEFVDSPEDLLKKVKQVAQLIRESNHCVVFTGAGISTAAKLPGTLHEHYAQRANAEQDYRGPQGAWTLGSRGFASVGREKRLSEAFPTFTHYAITALVKHGVVKYVLSTNMDGLHLRSGLPKDQLSELHGNCFREICTVCRREYHRKFDTLLTRVDRWTHLTGRLCHCGGALRDTIVHFTENWSFPEEAARGADNCYRSDVAIALGTSMLVQPAVSFPGKTLKNNGSLVIVTLQVTPYDDDAAVKVYARTDDFMAALVTELDVVEFDTQYDLNDELPDEEVLWAPRPRRQSSSSEEESESILDQLQHPVAIAGIAGVAIAASYFAYRYFKH
jgi:mono-ADP-ribosyltransferase sirtuin 6